MACECGAEPSSRDKAIVIRGEYDGPLIYQCGVCGEYRPRFNVPTRLHDVAVEIIATWKLNEQAE